MPSFFQSQACLKISSVLRHFRAKAGLKRVSRACCIYAAFYRSGDVWLRTLMPYKKIKASFAAMLIQGLLRMTLIQGLM